MELAFLVFGKILQAFLYVMDFAFLLRVIFSVLDPMQEMSITRFLYVMTEPLILPVRRLCERMHWFEGVPIDIPFMLTWLLLMIVQMLLEVF